MTLTQLRVEVGRIQNLIVDLPEDQREAVVEREIAKFAPNVRETLTALSTLHKMTAPSKDNLKAAASERNRVWVAGIFFLLLLLAVVIFVPNPTPAQFFIFRVISALGAGAFAALIPGFLSVDARIKNSFAIRATGALAVTFIVYWINPPSLVAPAPAGNPVGVSPSSSPALQQPVISDSSTKLPAGKVE
jgi:hypothetical protein